MSEKDFNNIFQEDNNIDSLSADQDFAFEDDSSKPGRTRINDFKHSSSTIQRGGGGDPVKHGRKKAYININDEKIVWVGAIFVFFGILLFFIGFSLGKITVKDDLGPKKQVIQSIEDNLSQKITNNDVSLISQTNQGTSQQIITPPPPPVENNSTVTQVTAIYVTNSAIQASARQPTNVIKIKAAKNVKLRAGETTNRSDIKLQNANNPETAYTIQVSADTSIDKARVVEDNLRNMGFQTYLVEADVNGTTYYRIRVGRFSGKSDAEIALAKIKDTDFGKDSYLVNLD